MPAIDIFAEFAEAGGLLAYGPNFSHILRRAGGQVARILRGARPADLPVERPAKFELVVNLKTARALNVTVPASVRALGDKLID